MMESLDESEVTQVLTHAPPEGTVVEIDNERYVVGPKGELRIETHHFNNPFADEKAINQWNRRAWEFLSGPRQSAHILGRAPRGPMMAKRRAKAKSAKLARRVNRHS